MRELNSVTSTPTTLSEVSVEPESLPGNVLHDIQIMNFGDCVDNVDKQGLYIWRIQDDQLVVVKENDHGYFHEETVYIVLNVKDDESKSLHHWRGRYASEVDSSTGHEKIHQIDQQLGGAHIFSRQCHGYESTCFSCLFPEGIIYIEGNPKTFPRKAAKYNKKLYTISDRGPIRAQCVDPIVEELSISGAAILDSFPRFYVWIGDKCPYNTRIKAIDLARKMKNTQRKGHVHIIVIDSTDSVAEQAFLKKLRSKLQSHAMKLEFGTINTRLAGQKPALHRLSGEKVLYDMPVVASRPLQHKYLIRHDSYLLDSGPMKPLYVWVGHQAASRDLADAVIRGMLFSNHHNYPCVNPVCRVREGWETEEFKHNFITWKNSTIRFKNRSKSRSSSCISAGRVRTARSERSVVDLSDDIIGISSDNDMVDCDGGTEIWVVVDDNLEAVPWERHGIFSNGYCYIILHHTMHEDLINHILYYWLGMNSTSQDQKSTIKLSQSINSSLNNTATVIRILDGKEPMHMLTALQHSMIVYDSNIPRTKNGEQMFTVIEAKNGSMKVNQVSSDATHLKSTSVIVYLSDVDCILWYGKESGGSEREYAKTILEFLIPSRRYTFDVILEGKESAYFRNLLDGRRSSVADNKIYMYARRTPRFLHCNLSDPRSSTTDLHNLTQLELTDDNIFFVDFFNQILVWYGKFSSHECKERIPQLLLDYLESDPAGRKEENIELWFINQGSEPSHFTQVFPCWRQQGYGSKLNYDLARKKVRQENAITHIHVEIDDLDHVTKPKYDPFILLKPCLPDDVDMKKKQDHLSDSDFIGVYKVARSEFYRLPFWKQGQILRSSKLYS